MTIPETKPKSVVLDANGVDCCINVEKARWHSSECLVKGFVMMESKGGWCNPLREEEIMKL